MKTFQNKIAIVSTAALTSQTAASEQCYMEFGRKSPSCDARVKACSDCLSTKYADGNPAIGTGSYKDADKCGEYCRRLNIAENVAINAGICTGGAVDGDPPAPTITSFPAVGDCTQYFSNGTCHTISCDNGAGMFLIGDSCQKANTATNTIAITDASFNVWNATSGEWKQCDNAGGFYAIDGTCQKANSATPTVAITDASLNAYGGPNGEWYKDCDECYPYRGYSWNYCPISGSYCLCAGTYDASRHPEGQGVWCYDNVGTGNSWPFKKMCCDRIAELGPRMKATYPIDRQHGNGFLSNWTKECIRFNQTFVRARSSDTSSFYETTYDVSIEACFAIAQAQGEL